MAHSCVAAGISRILYQNPGNCTGFLTIFSRTLPMSNGMLSGMNTAPSARPAHDGKYPGYWQVKALRRQLRNRLSRWLARRRAADPAVLVPMDPARIRRVIVCRRNHRLGNMLMLTPLLRTLSAAVPHAEIDLLIGSRDYSELFRGLPGVCRVWALPTRGWLWPFRMLHMLIRLRRRRYDLCIEPSINSFSNRLSARLCGAESRLGFHTPAQWLTLTHPVVPDPAVVHDALIPVQLIRDGIRQTTLMQSRLCLALTAEELAAGQARLRATLGAAHAPVIGFFIEATGRKRLSPDWWRAWAWRLSAQQPGTQLLQILPPGATVLQPGIPSLCEPNHRRLAAVLAQLDLFVSCDAGPMHLAGAAGTPTIGLFHASHSAQYRPLGKPSLALEVAGLGPDNVAQAVAGHLQVVLTTVGRKHPQFASRRTAEPVVRVRPGAQMDLEAGTPVQFAGHLDTPPQPLADAADQVQTASDPAAARAPVIALENPR
jgi:ADP-heptose:LPS heptosyltransferase